MDLFMNSKKIAVTVFLCLVIALICFEAVNAQTGIPLQPASTSSPGIEEINLPITVLTEKGNVVTELPQERFSVLLDNSPQPITSFSNQDKPASIAILIDLSGSVREKFANKFDIIKTSLGTFIQASNPSNEYAIYTFSRGAQLEMDWTENNSVVLNKINQINVEKKVGVTSLFDACIDAIQSLRGRKNRKRIVLVISDGIDNNSKYKDSDVKKLSHEILAPIFFVNVGAMRTGSIPKIAGGTLDLQAQATSENIASASGGVGFLPNTQSELSDSFKRIVNYIRHQYLIEINPTSNSQDGKKHRLQIRISLPPDAPKEMKNLKLLYSQFYIAKKQ